MFEPKKILPQFIKFPLWYIFKSPQRQFGLYSILTDFVGIFRYIFFSVFKMYNKRPISICVGIFNRSPLFLKHFISSLAKAKNLHLIELSVVDCGSTDIENLELEIRKIYKGVLIFKSQPMPFSRAKVFNMAVKQSTNSKIFICDADFCIPKNIVDFVNRFTIFNSVWFPIVFYLYKNKPAICTKNNGEWMQWGGKGILACNKFAFNQVGKLNEEFTNWGQEDEEFFLRFYQHKYVIIRNRCNGLLHHWHPSLNVKYQKLEMLADAGKL